MSSRRGTILATAAVAALILCLVPASASARKPIIAYVDGGQFKLYDVELGADVAVLPVPVPANPGTFNWAISHNGRFVFYENPDGELHLLDRDIGGEVPLPGINVYGGAVGSLSVSGSGLLAFDNNNNGPALVYNANTGGFVSTGFPANNENRETQLSGNGMFLVTTCDDPDAPDCPAATANSDMFVQNLATMTDTGFPVDAAKDEQDPCINGDGRYVALLKQVGAGDKDNFVYDRSVSPPLLLPTAGLNDPAEDDPHCSMDSSGNYIAHQTGPGGATFALYDRSIDAHIGLPAKPFESGNFHHQVLSDPFSPSPKPQSASTTPAAAAPIAAPAKKCKKGFRLTTVKTKKGKKKKCVKNKRKKKR